MSRLTSRIHKLEVRSHPDLPRCIVLWDYETYIQDKRPQDLVVRLVHKAESAEAWVSDVRRRNPAFFEHGRDTP